MTHEQASPGGPSENAPKDRTGPDVRRAADAAAEPARLRLDALLTELMERAGEVLETQGRLRSLLDAVVSVSEDLSLEAVLLRIVTAACRLVDARYGALGLLSSDGQDLSDFITVGLSNSEVAAIGDLPSGRGILGVLIEQPEPLCLALISDHPKSHGFPPNHPPMSTFLGVPIRLRNEVFGNLYLTEKANGKDFTDEDEQLVVALAAAAGVAVQNAQLYDAQQRRQLWLAASSEVRTATLSGISRGDLADLIVDEARAAAEAALVALVVPDPQGSPRVIASTAPAVIGIGVPGLARPAAASSPPEAVDLDGGDRAIEEMVAKASVELSSCLAAPIGQDENSTTLGTLLIGYPAGPRRHVGDRDYAVGYAASAGLALQLAQAQHDRERLVVLEDRDRIARDLHDLVIQRLFATGMTLQSTAPLIENDKARQRLATVVDDLDATIRDLRQAIYELQAPVDSDDLRAEIQHVLDQAVGDATTQVRLHFSGMVASLVPDEVRPHLLAVLREAVSNVVRHAGATSIDISVAVDGDLILKVTDDGVGLDPGIARRSGLANLSSRAQELGGTLETGPGERGIGTTVIWQVPLEDPDPS